MRKIRHGPAESAQWNMCYAVAPVETRAELCFLNIVQTPVDGQAELAAQVGEGAGYVYTHQGCCEHLVELKDIRAVQTADPALPSAFPVTHYEVRCCLASSLWLCCVVPVGGRCLCISGECVGQHNWVCALQSSPDGGLVIARRGRRGGSAVSARVVPPHG